MFSPFGFPPSMFFIYSSSSSLYSSCIISFTLSHFNNPLFSCTAPALFLSPSGKVPILLSSFLLRSLRPLPLPYSYFGLYSYPGSLHLISFPPLSNSNSVPSILSYYFFPIPVPFLFRCHHSIQFLLNVFHSLIFLLVPFILSNPCIS